MLGDGLGAAAGLADAQHQGAQAAQQEPALEAAEDGAIGPAQVDDALPEGVVAGGDEGAGEHVAVAVEVLGRGMHDDVGAVLDGAGQHGRRRGAVDAQDGAGTMGDVGDGGDVGDQPARVGRRLDPDHACLPGPHGRGDGVQVSHVHEVDGDAPGLQQLEQPCAQRPVHLLGRHDVVAGLEGLEDAW